MIAARAETRFLPGVLIPGLLAAQLVTTAFAQTTPSQRTAGSRPNILWITCEDMSPDLGCYGDSYARTPTLDNLAAQGVRYTNVFSVAGVCAPSRSAIITGMYPCSIGTHHMRCKGVPPAHVKCFTEYLRAAGYYCTNNVKTDYNFDAPVTAWDECSAKADWRGRAPGQPFFSVINITTTHEGQIRSTEQKFALHMSRVKPEDRHDPLKAVLPPYYPDTPIVRRDWARYYDLITSMDAQVAEILQRLEADGLADSTIVFFFSDHGRGLPRAKRWLYDSGLHVPMIVRWPDRSGAGSTCDDLVSFVDLAPTVLSLAGVEIPEHMQGGAFLGDQKVAKPREYVCAARDRMDETYDIIRAVRDKQYKYIRNFRPGRPYAQYIHYAEQMPTMQEMRRLYKEGKLTGPQKIFFLPEKPEEELYDTQADPHEINNLAGSAEHATTLERMRKALEDWMTAIGDLAFVPEEELNERMRPGGKWAKTEAPVISLSRGGQDGVVTVTITCSTPGASIAYTTQSGKDAHWLLYSKPVELPGSATLRAKAIRLGYLESDEVERRLQKH